MVDQSKAPENRFFNVLCWFLAWQTFTEEQTIQQRIIAALEDWQKKYLRTNETIKMISSGKHILYHCNVTNVCGDAEIYCFDSVISSMSDHAQAELITGNSLIRHACGNVQNQLPRCKHSSTVLGSYVAAHSTCLSLLLPQARKRGMKVCLSLFYI